MSYTFHLDRTQPEPNPATVWVFGSHLAGRHGRGAAQVAVRRFGAKWGCGVGFAGNSFAIATKDRCLRVLPLEQIRLHVDQLLQKAHSFEQLSFFVTRIGCGCADYRDDQIAPLLKRRPIATSRKEWRPYLEIQPNYEIQI